MPYQGFFIGVVVLAMINGILISPFKLVILTMSPGWYPGFLPRDSSLLLYMSNIFVSTLTIMISGVPAALYERIFGGGKPSATSMGIWLGAAFLLTLPAISAGG